MTTLQQRIGRDQLLRVLAGSMTPSTLAAVIADLQANDQSTDKEEWLADIAQAAFATQLEGMVGEEDAMEMVMEAAGFGERGDGGLKYPCDGCGRGTAKIGEACDHCGTKIECAAF